METIILILTVFVLYITALIACERSIIYHPSSYPDGLWEPETFGVKVEDVFFQSEDGTKLHGWFIPVEGALATLLRFHGNAGNLTHRLENIIRLQVLKLNVFIFDYRGYGKSEGQPNEQGIYLDSLAAYEALVQNKNISPESS